MFRLGKPEKPERAAGERQRSGVNGPRKPSPRAHFYVGSESERNFWEGPGAVKIIETESRRVIAGPGPRGESGDGV